MLILVCRWVPLRLLDEIGIDVADKVSKIFHQNFGERARPCVLMSRLVQSSYYGKKNQKGFYLYDDKFKEIGENKSLYTEFKTKTLPDHLLETAEQDVLDRGLYTMINEAARLLSEQVVSNPEDVDLGMIMGTGFPPFRGGLLRFADEVGFSQIIAKLEQLQKLHGSRFVCTPALKEKTSFYSKKH